jgi:ankyrin repeat protein
VGAASGDLQSVKFFVDNGGNINSVISVEISRQVDSLERYCGFSALLIACKYHRIDCIRYLLDHGADIEYIVPSTNQSSECCKTALMLVAEASRFMNPKSPSTPTHGIRLILDALAQRNLPVERIREFLNVCDKSASHTVLMDACLVNSIVIVSELLDWSHRNPDLLDVNFQISFHRSAMSLSCDDHSGELVRLLLTAISPPPVVDRYALLTACRKGNSPSISLMLQHPTCPNLNDLSKFPHYPRYVTSPLVEAILANSPEIVDLLIQHRSEWNPIGATPDIPDEFKRTPLLRSIAENKLDSLQALLPHLDLDLQDHRGYTPLRMMLQETKLIPRLLRPFASQLHGMNLFLEAVDGVSDHEILFDAPEKFINRLESSPIGVTYSQEYFLSRLKTIFQVLGIENSHYESVEALSYLQ